MIPTRYLTSKVAKFIRSNGFAPLALNLRSYFKNHISLLRQKEFQEFLAVGLPNLILVLSFYAFNFFLVATVASQISS
jgi:hypothetical protein